MNNRNTDKQSEYTQKYRAINQLDLGDIFQQNNVAGVLIISLFFYCFQHIKGFYNIYEAVKMTHEKT